MKLSKRAIIVFVIYFFSIATALLFTTSAAAGPYDGNWSGTTDQGNEVSFSVSNDNITSFKIKIRIPGSFCTVTVTKTITGGSFSIIEDSFTISGRSYDPLGSCWNDYEYSGTFGPGSECSGTYSDESCYCNGSVSGSWSATKAPEPNISVSPASHDFVNVPPGSSDSQGFTISSSGDEDLEIGTISLTGADANEFSLENDTCSDQTVPAGDNCTFDVRFAPATEDNKFADVDVPSNDPDTPTLTVPLQGYQYACNNIPHTQDFSGGKPLNEWQYYSSTGYGRIDVVDGKLRMDTSQSGDYNLNEAILCLDLLGYDNVRLTFFQSEHGDENHSLADSFSGHAEGDGVAISNDGDTWYTILNDSDLDVGSAGKQFTIDLDSEIRRIQSNFDASFGYTSEFKIKFQQYDNLPYSSDGREWDDIAVTYSDGNLCSVYMLLLTEGLNP